jgi:hypothetical protein
MNSRSEVLAQRQLRSTEFKIGQLLIASKVHKYLNFASIVPVFMSIIKSSNGRSDGIGHWFVQSISDIVLLV